MPGMNSGVNIGDPAVTAAFRAALAHQGLIALGIFVLAGLAWLSLRAFLPQAVPREAAAAPPEPAWRQVLRIGFGSLWLFDGILQAQPAVAIGLPSYVIAPVAASSPRWVQHLVNWAGTAWSYHPLQAGASVVWIQAGIGLWLLAAARGPLSRLAGLAAAGWGLVVWVFGESFGGIFAPGLTWLFGAPGAAAPYCVAGALIALPGRAWHWPRLGRLMMAGLGVFLAGMAVLQAWPGRGFWQGRVHGRPGPIAVMTASMASTPQPHALSALITAFTGFDESHGLAVNLFAVTVLAVVGAAFLTGRPRLARPALVLFTVVCLADWVLIEDLGFLGGLGTDPSSMIPFVLLAAAGYLALAGDRAPGPAPAAGRVGAASGVGSWRAWLRAAARPRALGQASLSSAAAIGAIGMVILGAAPMAAAQASHVASPMLARAIGGASPPLDYAARPFRLTDQHGRPVTLAGLRGKVVLLTFLDPVPSRGCALEARELKQAWQLLGAAGRHVELVAIVASPVDYQIGYTQAFDRQEELAGVRSWLYLTGSLPQLRLAWAAYGIAPAVEPAGPNAGQSGIVFAIDARGRVRQEFDISPGPAAAAAESSFAAELAGAARQLLARS